MADIFHIYPPQLPGYNLSPIYENFSFDVTINFHCSILRNNDETYTFYFADCSYNQFGSSKYLKNLQIDTVNFQKGQELLCWFCKKALLVDGEMDRRIFLALNEFDVNLAKEFKEATNRCKNCKKKGF